MIQYGGGDLKIVHVAVVEGHHDSSRWQVLFSRNEGKNIIQRNRTIFSGQHLHLFAKNIGGVNNFTQAADLRTWIIHDRVIKKDSGAFLPIAGEGPQNSAPDQ